MLYPFNYLLVLFFALLFLLHYRIDLFLRKIF